MAAAHESEVVIGVTTQHFVKCRHSFVEFSQNAEECALGAHNIEDDAIGLIGAVAETKAVFVEKECFFEVVGLKLFGGLGILGLTRSSFCLRMLIF